MSQGGRKSVPRKLAVASPARAARLADVAKAAGVSQGTVSNVFNRPQLVRDEVRERVRNIAQQLGYAGPDPRGRLLRAGKVNAIGVATVERLSHFFEDPYARVLMTGITHAADANGVGISLISAQSEEELAWNVRSALVDGLILFCLEGADRLIAMARERQLPFVALAFGHRDGSIPAVGVDDVAGARGVAEHLVRLGHRRFAIIGLHLVEGGAGRATREKIDATFYTVTRDRIAGYLEAIAAAGVDPGSVPVFETRNDTPTVEAAMEEIFAAPEPPTAILAQSDRAAFVALDWLRRHGLRVPEDVSVVGYDGVPESATSEPPLTTVAQPIAEIGKTAVEMILNPPAATGRVALPTRLILRKSTAAPPRA
ncbi:MAG: LacI family DNA-binding transcriptional regulator [Bauldia sp.]|nr:LacI family DNA-binding transcriptional regulator [Bauldia sp.]